MAEEVTRFLDEWHRIVAEKDLAALGGVLAEEVSMGAPLPTGPGSGGARSSTICSVSS